jgi:hypothetical protein
VYLAGKGCSWVSKAKPLTCIGCPVRSEVYLRDATVSRGKVIGL